MTAPLEMFRADEIVVGERLRRVDAATVDALAESISKIGLQTPLTVRRHGKEVRLVTGAHRLAAVMKIGMRMTPCFVMDGDETDAKLWEIAENLHRAELSTLDRSEQIAEWVKLSAGKIFLAQVAPKPGRPESGVRAASRELGIERTEVQRAVKIASISDEAKDAAAAAGLADNQSALLQIARAPAPRQVETVREIIESRANKIDADVKSRAAREVAEIIAEYVPADAWDGIKANLYAAGAAGIANALTNITGQSVMGKEWG
jgi:ParB/RepB/Spo0J family partition protein